MTDEELYALCGGQPIRAMRAANDAAELAPPIGWDFGYRPVPRTDDQQREHQVKRAARAAAASPEDAPVLFVGKKVYLWLYLKLANGGTLPPFNWQWSGSCVNGGAQNCLMVLQGVEIALMRQPEAFKLPFTLAAYGESRRKAYNITSPGDGSDGDYMAEALRDYGTVATADDPAVPKPYNCGAAFVYDRDTELNWGGTSTHPAGIADRCKKHRLKFVPVLSADAAEAQLRRGRPLTWAGVWGGLMGCPLQGSPAVRMNKRVGTWSHQQSCLGMWDHPTEGRIFYIQNQWFKKAPGSSLNVTISGGSFHKMVTPGPVDSVHGNSPNGEPEGGYWISEDDMDWQCKHQYGDVNALYAYDGFDGAPLDP